MTTIIDKINKLPDEIIDIIKEYIPKQKLVFTNKSNYLLYHSILKKTIKNYDNYIRDMIRRDNEFVFNLIVRENYKKWYEIKQYKYKNMIFTNYLYFTINYCIEHDSNNCRNSIDEFLKQEGLGKNLHKKNVIKYIRWKD
jgi:hypothetical protein